MYLYQIEDNVRKDNWVFYSKKNVKDPLETPLNLDDNYDVILFATSNSPTKELLVDLEIAEIILSDQSKSKAKAVELNIRSIPPFNGEEWTYIDVNSIIDNFISIDFIAFHKCFDLFKDIKYHDHLISIIKNKQLKIGVLFNRLVKDEAPKYNYDLQKLYPLLVDTFEECPKNQIDSDCIIVTAADDYSFPGLQLMLISLILSHEVQVVVYDLGLSPENRNWLDSTLIPVIDNPLVIMPKEHYLWQSWNKPFYISELPFRYVLWIDSDTCVLRNLKPAFELIKKQGFFCVADNAAKNRTVAADRLHNYSYLYEELPVPKILENDLLNAGVLGFDLQSDVGLSIINNWKEAIHKAVDNEKIRNGFKWHDQAALLWTLEKLELTHLIRPEPYWNDCYSWHSCGTDFIENYEDLLVKLQKISSGIIHFSGKKKPWRGHV